MFQLVQLHDENAQGILTTKKKKKKKKKKKLTLGFASKMDCKISLLIFKMDLVIFFLKYVK